jgi:hypothetical protein
MWETSQQPPYSRGIRNPRRSFPSIPLIMPGVGFIALMNSFTEAWGGFFRPLIGRSEMIMAARIH